MFCTLVGAYFGIRELDEYKLKEYMLFDFEKKIKAFYKEHPIENYEELVNKIEKLPLKNKLQDCLIVLPKWSASMELILLIKEKLRSI